MRNTNIDPKISLIAQMYNELSDEEKSIFSRLVNGKRMTQVFNSENLGSFLRDNRFTEETACCVHCGSIHFRKAGKVDDRQVFRCGDCGRKFRYTSKTIFQSAKLSLETYMKYIHCMMSGMSIRATAFECGISKNSAFYLRHKILDALQEMEDEVQLDGVVEADETFFTLSFKGNHSRSRHFRMPRPARHRGSSNHTRGLSAEMVCVPCAVNLDGKSYAKVSGLGAANQLSIDSVLKNRISRESILCTDLNGIYGKYALENGLVHVQIKSNQRKSGVFTIQHINNYHSRLKGFLRPFNGVATKYLNNYLVWFNLARYAKGGRGFVESVWDRHNAKAKYVGSKWDFMKRPVIQAA